MKLNSSALLILNLNRNLLVVFGEIAQWQVFDSQGTDYMLELYCRSLLTVWIQWT